MARENGEPEDPVDFETKFQVELHKALGRSIPAGTTQENVPHAEIIRGLGLLAATFAVQSGLGQRAFAEGMVDYYQGVCKALDIPVEETPIQADKPLIIAP